MNQSFIHVGEWPFIVLDAIVRNAKELQSYSSDVASIRIHPLATVDRMKLDDFATVSQGILRSNIAA